jgi:hypothetical protein
MSSNGAEYVQSEDTVQVARHTAVHVRRRAKHQISLQRNAGLSHGHQLEHTIAKDGARVHYGDVYNTSISIVLVLAQRSLQLRNYRNDLRRHSNDRQPY